MANESSGTTGDIPNPGIDLETARKQVQRLGLAIGIPTDGLTDEQTFDVAAKMTALVDQVDRYLSPNVRPEAGSTK